MDFSTFIPLLSTWVTHKFPSLREYAEYVGPGLTVLFTFLGVFTNLLPEPGHKYAVPNVADLELQLQGGGKFIVRIAKMARTVVISINWFVGTSLYSGFYTVANKVSKILPKFKKKPTVEK